MTELSTETRTALLAAVKVQLGIVDTTQDAKLDGLITRANAYVEHYLGFPVEPGEFTETLDIGGYPAPLLMPFSRLDVTEIVSIEADGLALASTAGIWRFDKASMAIRFYAPLYIESLTVTYRAGGEDGLHPLMMEAMLNLIIALYQQGPSASGAIPLPPGVGSLVSIDIPGVYRASFRDSGNGGRFQSIMPASVSEILDTFRAESV